jgi:hypothetical protein
MGRNLEISAATSLARVAGPIQMSRATSASRTNHFDLDINPSRNATARLTPCLETAV